MQPQEKLNAFLNLADIHRLPQEEDAADLVMPSKLTGMLASGRPVVATARAGTQVAKVVEKAGLVVEPCCLPCMVAAIRRLGDDEPGRQRLGTAARDYAINVSKGERVLLGFEDQLRDLAIRAPEPPPVATT